MVLLVTSLPGILTQNFTLLRKDSEPDSVVRSHKVLTDENTITENGRCVDAKRTIASQHHDNILRCFDDAELEHLGNGT